MSLSKTYFESKGRDISVPIPETPGYTPPIVPPAPVPADGEQPSIYHPTFTGTTTCILYNCTAENMIVDKTSYLTQVRSYALTIKDETDLINPEILIEENISILNCNYMMFAGRYYYIIEKTLIKGNLYRLRCKEDVLMTFNDQIRTQRGIVARQEHSYNLYLDDGMYQVTGQRDFKTLRFSKSPLQKGLEYVLMTVGGAVTS